MNRSRRSTVTQKEHVLVDMVAPQVRSPEETTAERAASLSSGISCLRSTTCAPLGSDRDGKSSRFERSTGNPANWRRVAAGYKVSQPAPSASMTCQTRGYRAAKAAIPWPIRRSCHAKHVHHRVQARRLADHPQRRPHRAGGEGTAVEGAVGQRDVLGGGGEDQRVLAHHLAAAQRREADRARSRARRCGRGGR